MKPKFHILFLGSLIAVGLLFAAALPARAQKSRDPAKVFEKPAGQDHRGFGCRGRL